MDYAIALQLITAGLNTITTIANYISKVREAAKQSGRLTPEQSKALDDLIANAPNKPEWKVDQPPI